MNGTASIEGEELLPDVPGADLDRTLRAILEQAIPELGDWCFVDTIDRSREVQRLLVVHPKDAPRELVRALEEYPAHLDFGSDAVEDTEPSIRAGLVEGRLPPDHPYAAALNMIAPQTALVVPIGSTGRALGRVEFLYSDVDRRHHGKQLAAADVLGKRVGIVLEGARLREGLRRAEAQNQVGRSRVHKLRTAAKIFARARSEDEVLEAILEHVVEAAGAVGGALMINPSDASRSRWLVREDGETQAVLPSQTAAAIMSRAAMLGRAKLNAAVAPMPFSRTDTGRERPLVRALAALPLFDRTVVLGSVGLGFATSSSFSDDDREFFDLLAECCATAITAARAREGEARLERALDDAQNRARTERALTAKVLSCAPVVATVLEGPSHKLTWINASAIEHSGGDQSAYLSRPHAEVEPELHAKIGAVLDEVYDSGEPRVLPDVEVGGTRFLRVSAVPVPGDGDRERGLVLMTLDITEQRRAEAERGELLAREQQARARAEQADRMKDEFLARVSHELATPLAAMKMWTHLLAKRSGAAFPKEIEAIERCCDAQSRLVSDLLDVSRALRGKLSMERAMVELSTIVGAVVETFRPEAEEKNLELVAHLEKDAFVDGDASRLRQVATNLLSNAMKFTNAGGHVSVTVRVPDSETDVELIVEDDGLGIEPDLLANIFEPFWQADGSATRSHGGLGLGLAIVKQIVGLHGGSVHAHSDGPGRGAKLTVRLAYAGTAEVAPSAPPKAVEEVTLRNLDVLIVEDDNETRTAVSAVLATFGAKVRAVDSADAGWLELTQRVPDVLLCDLAMPGEDGYAFIRRVRASKPPRSKVLAIAFTAHARQEDRKRVMEAGFDEHLAKPMAPPELAAALSRLARAR